MAVKIFFFFVFLSGIIIIISYLLKILFLKFNEYLIFPYLDHLQTSATHQKYGKFGGDGIVHSKVVAPSPHGF